jgi:hypothetical protein
MAGGQPLDDDDRNASAGRQERAVVLCFGIEPADGPRRQGANDVVEFVLIREPVARDVHGVVLDWRGGGHFGDMRCRARRTGASGAAWRFGFRPAMPGGSLQ